MIGPFARLGDLVGGSLETIGEALSAFPALLNHETHRIAVTGLQRAGKTVFVTSITHALLHAATAQKADFPFFPWRDRLLAVGVRSIDGIPLFPYPERLAGLLRDTPTWPEHTKGLTGLRIRIEHTPVGAI